MKLYLHTFKNFNNTMFLKLLILTGLLVSITLLGLGIRLLLKRGGGFPETHVGHNPEMKKRGLGCAKLTDTGCTPAFSEGCEACSSQIRD
jgi:hypothetical protein